MTETKIATHASEGGHWYTSAGEQIETVVGANGKRRKPTLRDARKHGWGPGVTTIIKCAAAPGLERWKTNQAVMSALTAPRAPGVSDEQHLATIAAEAAEDAKEAARVGTEIHAAIQGELSAKSCDPGGKWRGWTDEAYIALQEIGVDPPECEVGCAHPYGYGTKADLVGGGWLIDWKTKAGSGDGGALTPSDCRIWDNHRMQLAATARALTLLPIHYGIGFIAREVPQVLIVEVPADEIERGWAMFYSLLRYWQAEKRHNPDWMSS